MMKKIILTDKAPAPIGPYSQAYLCARTLYCSGQIAIEPMTGEFLNGSIEEQTLKVMENISALLEEAGYGFEDVVKTTCYLAYMSDFTVFNEIYARYFTSKPARSCVAAKELPKNALVEVEVIAFK